MNRADLPPGVHSHENHELGSGGVYCPPAELSLSDTHGACPGDIVLHDDPHGSAFSRNSTRELNVAWQMVRPVLGSGLDPAALEHDCIVGKERERGSAVACG